jgi:hypothetical protein
VTHSDGGCVATISCLTLSTHPCAVTGGSRKIILAPLPPRASTGNLGAQATDASAPTSVASAATTTAAPATRPGERDADGVTPTDTWRSRQSLAAIATESPAADDIQSLVKMNLMLMSTGGDDGGGSSGSDDDHESISVSGSVSDAVSGSDDEGEKTAPDAL